MRAQFSGGKRDHQVFQTGCDQRARIGRVPGGEIQQGCIQIVLTLFRIDPIPSMINFEIPPVPKGDGY